MPTDGAKAFRPICLDRKQLGLVSEKGPIMDRQKIKEKKVVGLGNKEYV